MKQLNVGLNISEVCGSSYQVLNFIAKILVLLKEGFVQ